MSIMFKTYGYMIIVLTAKNLTHLLGKHINLVKKSSYVLFIDILSIEDIRIRNIICLKVHL